MSRTSEQSERRGSGYGAVRIGVSGWRYKPWRGAFYPKKLPQARELSYLSSIFPSVEINGTFYSLQRMESFARWAEATPDEFVFAVKAPRFITHIRRLKEIETPLANFFASGVLRLGPPRICEDGRPAPAAPRHGNQAHELRRTRIHPAAASAQGRPRLRGHG